MWLDRHKYLIETILWKLPEDAGPDSPIYQEYKRLLIQLAPQHEQEIAKLLVAPHLRTSPKMHALAVDAVQEIRSPLFVEPLLTLLEGPKRHIARNALELYAHNDDRIRAAIKTLDKAVRQEREEAVYFVIEFGVHNDVTTEGAYHRGAARAYRIGDSPEKALWLLRSDRWFAGQEGTRIVVGEFAAEEKGIEEGDYITDIYLPYIPKQPASDPHTPPTYRNMVVDYACNRSEFRIDCAAAHIPRPFFLRGQGDTHMHAHDIVLELLIGGFADMPDYVAFLESRSEKSAETWRTRAMLHRIGAGDYLPLRMPHEEGATHGIIHLRENLSDSVFRATVYLCGASSTLHEGTILSRTISHNRQRDTFPWGQGETTLSADIARILNMWI